MAEVVKGVYGGAVPCEVLFTKSHKAGLKLYANHTQAQRTPDKACRANAAERIHHDIARL
jgi:hypothetical protein